MQMSLKLKQILFHKRWQMIFFIISEQQKVYVWARNMACPLQARMTDSHRLVAAKFLGGKTYW